MMNLYNFHTNPELLYGVNDDNLINWLKSGML